MTLTTQQIILLKQIFSVRPDLDLSKLEEIATQVFKDESEDEFDSLLISIKRYLSQNPPQNLSDFLTAALKQAQGEREQKIQRFVGDILGGFTTFLKTPKLEASKFIAERNKLMAVILGVCHTSSSTRVRLLLTELSKLPREHPLFRKIQPGLTSSTFTPKKEFEKTAIFYSEPDAKLQCYELHTCKRNSKDGGGIDLFAAIQKIAQYKETQIINRKAQEEKAVQDAKAAKQAAEEKAAQKLAEEKAKDAAEKLAAAQKAAKEIYRIAEGDIPNFQISLASSPLPTGLVANSRRRGSASSTDSDLSSSGIANSLSSRGTSIDSTHSSSLGQQSPASLSPTVKSAHTANTPPLSPIASTTAPKTDIEATRQALLERIKKLEQLHETYQNEQKAIARLAKEHESYRALKEAIDRHEIPIEPHTSAFKKPNLQRKKWNNGEYLRHLSILQIVSNNPQNSSPIPDIKQDEKIQQDLTTAIASKTAYKNGLSKRIASCKQILTRPILMALVAHTQKEHRENLKLKEVRNQFDQTTVNLDIANVTAEYQQLRTLIAQNKSEIDEKQYQDALALNFEQKEEASITNVYDATIQALNKLEREIVPIFVEDLTAEKVNAYLQGRKESVDSDHEKLKDFRVEPTLIAAKQAKELHLAAIKAANAKLQAAQAELVVKAKAKLEQLQALLKLKDECATLDSETKLLEEDNAQYNVLLPYLETYKEFAGVAAIQTAVNGVKQPTLEEKSTLDRCAQSDTQLNQSEIAALLKKANQANLTPATVQELLTATNALPVVENTITADFAAAKTFKTTKKAQLTTANTQLKQAPAVLVAAGKEKTAQTLQSLKDWETETYDIHLRLANTQFPQLHKNITEFEVNHPAVAKHSLYAAALGGKVTELPSPDATAWPSFDDQHLATEKAFKQRCHNLTTKAPTIVEGNAQQSVADTTPFLSALQPTTDEQTFLTQAENALKATREKQRKLEQIPVALGNLQRDTETKLTAAYKSWFTTQCVPEIKRRVPKFSSKEGTFATSDQKTIDDAAETLQKQVPSDPTKVQSFREAAKAAVKKHWFERFCLGSFITLGLASLVAYAASRWKAEAWNYEQRVEAAMLEATRKKAEQDASTSDDYAAVEAVLANTQLKAPSAAPETSPSEDNVEIHVLKQLLQTVKGWLAPAATPSNKQDSPTQATRKLSQASATTSPRKTSDASTQAQAQPVMCQSPVSRSSSTATKTLAPPTEQPATHKLTKRAKSLTYSAAAHRMC